MEKQESRFEKLEREGWKKQFIASEPRLSEAVELYKQSGFEVHLESVPKADEVKQCPQGEAGECRVCFEGNEDQYKVIYTRPNEDGEGLEDDLF
ncbi:MAG: hypothetical protein JRF34_04990 [Deltaproteobacteria bacterium]|nr:hypothetical protein [Deltaproteobacteria bacterium]